MGPRCPVLPLLLAASAAAGGTVGPRLEGKPGQLGSADSAPTPPHSPPPGGPGGGRGREVSASAPPASGGGRSEQVYSVYWDAVEPDCVQLRNCKNAPVDVTRFRLLGNNWTQTSANIGPGHGFPHLLANGSAVHGGVPQNADLPRILAGLRATVEAWLPDPNWAGNAIIDFEAYTPSWQLLESNYKTFSRNLVRQAHPKWGSAQVDAAASSAFEEKCNELFVGALQTARAARPKAYFGFYDIPRSYCPDCNLSWFARVVDASSAVFPSVYLQLPSAKDGLPPSLLSTIRNETFANFNRTVESAVSLAKGKPVYPFASMFNLVRPMTVLALQACLEAVQN